MTKGTYTFPKLVRVGLVRDFLIFHVGPPLIRDGLAAVPPINTTLHWALNIIVSDQTTMH